MNERTNERTNERKMKGLYHRSKVYIYSFIEYKKPSTCDRKVYENECCCRGTMKFCATKQP